jgi:hypothetical protein
VENNWTPAIFFKYIFKKSKKRELYGIEVGVSVLKD